MEYELCMIWSRVLEKKTKKDMYLKLRLPLR